MKFRFPIVIIDEDFRSENSSGLSIRALAQAFESEGFEVLGVTSYGDLSQFAQQQSRASAFILSIDDEEFTPGPDLDPAVLNLRNFIGEVRRKNADVPIYIYGETKTSRHLPNDILRERADAEARGVFGAVVLVDDDDREVEAKHRRGRRKLKRASVGLLHCARGAPAAAEEERWTGVTRHGGGWRPAPSIC